jgi:hypothetical protein
MTAHILTAPIPPYQNVPIAPQYYIPSRFVISDVILGNTTIVTATKHMNYVIGQQVRLIIPPKNGCRQLNEKTGYVISIPSDDSVEVDIYSAGGDVYRTTASPNQPQILAIGDINNGYHVKHSPNYIRPIIPGSFINISPA